MLTKIYLFVDVKANLKCLAYALSEFGHLLVAETCSITDAHSELGFEGLKRHSIYWQYAPHGFELIWLDYNLDNEGFKKALDIHNGGRPL